MKYKEYPREYEKVFTSEGCLEKFSFDKFETDYPGGKDAYFNRFKEYGYDFERLFFRGIVQYYWLQEKFSYMGVSRKTKRSFIRADAAYATFVKHHVNFNYQLFTTTFFYNKVTTYLADFFPNYGEHNPFDEPEFFEFPYKHVTMGHLVLVYQMDERLDLLKKAEEEKMTYYEFMDFVLNYTLCVNDEHDRTIFTFSKPRGANTFPPYVQYHFRKGITGASAKKHKEIRRKSRLKKMV